MEKTLNAAISWPLYAAILTPNISDSSRNLILNIGVNTATQKYIICGSRGTTAFSVFFFKFQKKIFIFILKKKIIPIEFCEEGRMI